MKKHESPVVGQKIKATKEQGKQIVEAIKKKDIARLKQLLEKITSLSIYIGSDWVKTFIAGLENNRTLKKLVLDLYDVGEEGVEAIILALKNNQTLEKLRLCKKVGRGEGPKAIGVCFKTVEPIYVGGDERASTFAAILKDNKTLRTLDFSGNELGDKEAEAIAAALKDNRTLETLNLSRNRISSKGAEALVAALLHNQTLKELFLDQNKIGDEGATALVDLLRYNLTTLEKIDISDNTGISDALQRKIYRLQQKTHVYMLRQKKQRQEFQQLLQRETECLQTQIQQVQQQNELLREEMREMKGMLQQMANQQLPVAPENFNRKSSPPTFFNSRNICNAESQNVQQRQDRLQLELHQT